MKNNKKILVNEGKEYSEISREVEANYSAWLCASEISEADFLERINSSDMYLTYFADKNMALTIFHHATGEIAMPLTWQSQSNIALEEYKTDAALLLMRVASKCSNKESEKKIKEFIRKELR